MPYSIKINFSRRLKPLLNEPKFKNTDDIEPIRRLKISLKGYMKQITLSEVFKKHLKIVSYLLISGLLGYGLAYLADRPELVAVFAPAVNYVLFTIEKELKDEGVMKVLKQ